jgi:hypothetical protein
MKQLIEQRQRQIRRDFDQLKAIGWHSEDIFEELGKRYFLAPDTIRLNVYASGGYKNKRGQLEAENSG